jgi:hypothetical protein
MYHFYPIFILLKRTNRISRPKYANAMCLYWCFYVSNVRFRTTFLTPSAMLNAGADKSIALTTFRCRRTQSIV